MRTFWQWRDNLKKTKQRRKRRIHTYREMETDSESRKRWRTRGRWTIAWAKKYGGHEEEGVASDTP